MRLRAVAAGIVAGLMTAAPVAAVTPPAAAPPATAPAKPAAAAPAKAPAPAAPKAARKVWTASDLEKLRQQPSAVNWLETAGPPVPADAPAAVPEAAVEPQGVPGRLRELVNEATQQLDALQREKLAGSNPLLRGLAGRTPRDRETIEKDIVKWSDRLRAAQSALDNAERGGSS